MPAIWDLYFRCRSGTLEFIWGSRNLLDPMGDPRWCGVREDERSFPCSTRCSYPRASASSWWPFSTPLPATGCEAAMLIDFVLGGIVSLVITAYLVYALIRPERF